MNEMRMVSRIRKYGYEKVMKFVWGDEGIIMERLKT